MKIYMMVLVLLWQIYIFYQKNYVLLHTDVNPVDAKSWQIFTNFCKQSFSQKFPIQQKLVELLQSPEFLEFRFCLGPIFCASNDSKQKYVLLNIKWFRIQASHFHTGHLDPWDSNTGDLNSKHSNNRSIWIKDFFIRYLGYQLFRCPVPFLTGIYPISGQISLLFKHHSNSGWIILYLDTR